MAFETILVEQKNQTRWIYLNRPDQLNAIIENAHDGTICSSTRCRA